MSVGSVITDITNVSSIDVKVHRQDRWRFALL
jgi:hypothetical protein